MQARLDLRRLGLAPERVQQIGQGDGALGHVGVARRQAGGANRQGAPEDGLGLVSPALLDQDLAEVVERYGEEWVIRAESALEDAARAPVVGLGIGISFPTARVQHPLGA